MLGLNGCDIGLIEGDRTSTHQAYPAAHFFCTRQSGGVSRSQALGTSFTSSTMLQEWRRFKVSGFGDLVRLVHLVDHVARHYYHPRLVAFNHGGRNGLGHQNLLRGLRCVALRPKPPKLLLLPGNGDDQIQPQWRPLIHGPALRLYFVGHPQLVDPAILRSNPVVVIHQFYRGPPLLGLGCRDLL